MEAGDRWEVEDGLYGVWTEGLVAEIGDRVDEVN